MNNKSDKKHKPKHKKKTPSQSKKKKEIKNGGGFWSFLKTSAESNEMTKLKQPLLSKNKQVLNNTASSASRTHANSNTQLLPPPPPPPNAQPQGFNTLKAQSRCSIL